MQSWQRGVAWVRTKIGLNPFEPRRFSAALTERT